MSLRSRYEYLRQLVTACRTDRGHFDSGRTATAELHRRAVPDHHRITGVTGPGRALAAPLSARTGRGSTVDELVEPQLALQRQAAHRIMPVTVAVTLETAAFDQERRGRFHGVACQAEPAGVQMEQGVVAQLSGCGKNRDAIDLRRIQHGVNSRFGCE